MSSVIFHAYDSAYNQLESIGPTFSSLQSKIPSHVRWRESKSKYFLTNDNNKEEQHCPCCMATEVIGSSSKRRFCQHGRQPEVSCVVIDGEWWRQPFLFEIMNVKVEWLPLLISNKNGCRYHSPFITTQLTSGCRPCWQKRRLLKLSN